VVPSDGYAYNVSLQTTFVNFTSFFNRTGYALNQCPGNIPAQSFTSKEFASITGTAGFILMNVRPGGRYWVRFYCVNEIAPSYTLGAASK
jgi:hypothetical protein